MKRLLNVQTSVVDNKVTITADIDDFKFESPVQQVTVGYLNAINMAWPRHCQLSHEAFFVKAYNNGVGILLDELVKIAAIIEPKTTFSPITRGNLNDSFALQVSSEIPVSYQWEVSNAIGEAQNWAKIDGQTALEFDKTKVQSGQFVRCVITNDAGSFTTNSVIIP